MTTERQEYLQLLKNAQIRKEQEKVIKAAVKDVVDNTTKVPYTMSNLEKIHPAIREAIERASKRGW